MGSRALRNTVLVLAAKVVARLIALVTVIATLKQLMPAPYGTFITLVNYTAIVSVVLDLGFNVLYVREGARHPAEIQRYLRNVMSLRLVMAVGGFVVLAIALALAGLSSLLVPGFLLMVLTSYSTLLRNTLYAVQRLGYEAVAVILESAVLLALVLIGIKIGAGVTYFVWAYAAQYAFSCAYFAIVLWWQKIAVVGWKLEPQLVREWFFQGLPFALTFVLTILYFTWSAGWILVANLALNLILIPFFGYLGASWATVLTEVVLGVAGWVLTRRHIGQVPVLQLTWRPILAGLVMGAVLFPLRNLEGVQVVIPIVVGAAVYAGAALLLRAVTSDETAFARRALALAR